jgi:hypothetical protein
LQLVEPHNHHVNAAKCAIQIFKDAFIAVLATTDSKFPLQLWDRLMPQVKDTINLMRASRMNPDISAYEALNGPYNWNRNLLHPWGAKPLFTRMGITGGCGHQGALMDGTWAHQRTTTDVPFITSLKTGHIAYRG